MKYDSSIPTYHVIDKLMVRTQLVEEHVEMQGKMELGTDAIMQANNNCIKK